MLGFGRSKKPSARGAPPEDRALAGVDVPRVDFLVVGAMKCGTTTLRRALVAHPDVHMPAGEQHFFGNHRRYLSVWKGGTLDSDAFEREYAAAFRSGKRVVGGKTPNYVISSITLERIQRFHPGARMVLMVRCPIARAQSHWNHMLRQRDSGNRPDFLVGHSFAERVLRDVADLDDARDPDAEMRGTNLVWRRLYASQRLRLRHLFPSEHVFVGALEELHADPEAFLRGLCAFLGLAYDARMADAARRGGDAAPDHTVRLSAAERLMLREIYAEQVRELEAMVGRRMPGWLEA